ncbi:MAG: FprA family A-type flavoprotein [Treponema sp.]|jgi:flavorubredoxin|nr:FprA family A-type flavoprotein [Treponema sp.]
MDKTSIQVLFESERRKFIWIGAESSAEKDIIRTNQYLIIQDNKGFLVDPGGLHLFSRVVSAVSQFLPLDNIEGIFFSHQDPDVSSGIALWMGVTPAKIYISNLWLRFLPHFGIVDTSRIVPLADQQREITAGAFTFKLLPSHFMHSVGCYAFYDRESKILFTGDIGTADIAYDGNSLFVEDFQQHIPALEGFHKRYMNAQKVCQRWVQNIRPLDISILAPQHGRLYRGEQIKQFLDWLENLRCGTDLLDSIY